MDTFLDIVTIWFYLGTLFLVVFFALEIIAMITRPGYGEHLRKHSKETTPLKWMTFAITWFLAWPAIAIMTVIAIHRGITVTELMEDSTKKHEEASQQMNQKWDDALAKVKEAKCVWQRDEDASMLVLHRMLPTGPVLTHVVIIPPPGDNARIEAIRAMPNAKQSVGYLYAAFTQDNVDKVMDACVKDLRWAQLFVPGMEDNRQKVCKALHARFPEKQR
jgi:hypothetical protein